MDKRKFLPETLAEWMIVIVVITMVLSSVISAAFETSPHIQLQKKVDEQEKKIERLERSNIARDADLRWILKTLTKDE